MNHTKTFLTFSLVISLFYLSCANGDKKSENIIHNNDFNWTITIPKNFDTIDAKQWAKMQNKGAEAIEKTYGEKIENNANTIFVFKSDQYNYFESNYQMFDSSELGDYLGTVNAVNNMVYETFATQMPDAKLDSASSEETIDGLVFQVFRMKISFPNKMIMHTLLYSRLFGDKEFSVNITTVDEQKHKELLEAWKNSKFH